MTDPTPERASIRCDRHPDRLAVRYRASDKSRACTECVLSDACADHVERSERERA